MKNGTAQEGFFARRGQAERDRQRREQRAIEDEERTARAPRLLAEIAALQGTPADEPPAALLSSQAPIAMHATPATAAAISEPPASPVGTTVPDVFFDEIAPTLDNAELRVLLYLIRRTAGFKRQEDRVSLSQLCYGITTKDGRKLDAGTGLPRSSIKRALLTLKQRGLVVATRVDTEEHGHESTSYRVVLKGHSTLGPPADQARPSSGPTLGPKRRDPWPSSGPTLGPPADPTTYSRQQTVTTDR